MSSPESVLSANASSPTPESRSAEHLRENIEGTKESIAGTLKQLDRRLHRAADWRSQVSDHPFLAVGIAVAAGGLLSGVFRRRPTPRERILDALAESVEDITDQVRNRVVSHFTRGITSGMFKASAAALITKVAADYLRDSVGGRPVEHDVRADDFSND